MTAIDILTEDHKEVLDLIEQLERADDEAGTDPVDTEVFNRLREMLTLHTNLEEQIFYLALEEFDELAEEVAQAYAAHEQVDQLLGELFAISPAVPEFQETLAELKDILQDHIEQEEQELFTQAEELCGQSRLEEMGNQMQQIKQSPRTVAAMKKSS